MKEAFEQAIGSSGPGIPSLRTAEGELAGYIYTSYFNEKLAEELPGLRNSKSNGMPAGYLGTCWQDSVSRNKRKVSGRQVWQLGLWNYALNQFAEKGIGEVFIIC